MNTPQEYEFIEHTGDIRLMARGGDLAELFTNTALGMRSYLFGEIGRGQRTADEGSWEERVDIDAEGVEELMISWLSQLHYLISTGYAAPLEFNIHEISEQKLEAVVFFGARQAIEEIKAVTYYGLTVSKESGRWSACVTFDV